MSSGMRGELSWAVTQNTEKVGFVLLPAVIASLKDQYLIWHRYKWINSVVVVEWCIVAVPKYWNMWEAEARDRESAWNDVVPLLPCKIKESELPRLAIHVASVQILLFQVKKLKYR